MGRMAHIVVGQALDCNKLKIKVVLEPPSSGAISPCTCFGVKSVLTWVRELLKDCVAMDRGHKHSSGRSEIAIWLELRSHHVPNDTQELLPPPPPPASSPGAALPSTSSSAALSCAPAQVNTNIDTLTDAEMLELDAQLANFQTIVQMLDDSIENSRNIPPPPTNQMIANSRSKFTVNYGMDPAFCLTVAPGLWNHGLPALVLGSQRPCQYFTPQASHPLLTQRLLHPPHQVMDSHIPCRRCAPRTSEQHSYHLRQTVRSSRSGESQISLMLYSCPD